MFSCVRLILGFLALICAFWFIRKRHSQGIKQYVIASIAVFALITMSAFIPVENLLVSFESPEAAYRYSSFGYADIKLIVEGKSSDLVVGSKNDTDELLIVPRYEQGWKIGIGANTRKVVERIIDDAVVQVYQYKKTADYYIVVSNMRSGTVEISDIYGSDYVSRENYINALDEVFYTYYANLPAFDESYWVSVDGKVIWLW